MIAHYLSSAPRTLLLVALCLLLAPAFAQQESISYEVAFPELEFEFPVEIQTPGDGSDRLFVLEQPGRVKTFANDPATTTAQTFLDITDIVSFSAGQEIGLLGLAFHPDYATNGYFYLYHTRRSDVDGINVEMVLARYQVSDDNPDRADPSSRLELFSFDKNQPQSNHNGGKIAFGPDDGYLYISIGDGGGGGDPENNAQDLGNVFGSILRIDVDIDGSNPLESNPDAPNGNYEIPADNPRRGLSGLDEHYAWGIRNTWKFSFDDATGRLWGGDVGQNAREEINLIVAGGNYGWNRFEGNNVFRNSTNLVTTPDIKPVYTYDRSSGDRSITMGYVYRGRLSNPAIQGRLIFGDYVSGRVWALSYDENTGEASSELLFRTDGDNVSSFGLDAAGELYFSGYGQNAQIYRILDTDAPDPEPTAIDGVGSWAALGSGIDGTVEAVIGDDDGTIYAAGQFGLSVYTGSGWTSLADGADGRISALALTDDGNLYVGGNFSSINGTDAENVAVWNGSNWQALAAGTDGPVLSLLADGNAVYVGGAFTTAGTQTANNIARWNGNGWSALIDDDTNVAGTNNEVRSLALDGMGTLYVGGNFASAGGKAANRIATFDGNNWGNLGDGTSGFVQAIAVTEEAIYAGGNFAIAGNQTVNRIARWDRNAEQWSPLGRGVSGNVNALAYDGTYLYAGGNFETATTTDGLTYLVANAARWSPDAEWEALGSGTDVGTDNLINALWLDREAGNTELYAGGNFDQAGATQATGVAQWAEGFGIQDGAVYEMESQWNKNIRLAVRDNGTSDGTLVDGLPRDGSAGQQWRFLRVSGDIYEIEPINAPGKRLDVYGVRTTNNTPIIIWRRNGGANQRWRAIPIGDTGLYRFQPQHALGKRLDTEPVGGGLRRGFSRNSDGGQSQRWRLIPVSNPSAARATASLSKPTDTKAVDFTVFPNPTSGRLNVSGTADYRFELYDAVGRRVAEGRYPAGNTEVSVDHLPPGVYTARLSVEATVEASTVRIVVQ